MAEADDHAGSADDADDADDAQAANIEETEHQDRLARVRALIDAEPLLAGSETTDGLRRVCRAAVRALPATGVGLSVMTAAGGYGTVAASDPISALVEELQFTVGEGPGMDAVATGRPVLAADLDGVWSRWPAYAPTAYEHGVRAVFSFPLQIGAMRLGAMDVYRSRREPLSRAALRDAAAFAEVAVLVLLDDQGRAPDGQAAAVLHDGLTRRSEVYQAQGMVKIQLGVDLAEAMIRLRAYAYAHGRPLHEVANDVLARRLSLDGAGGVDGADGAGEAAVDDDA